MKSPNQLRKRIIAGALVVGIGAAGVFEVNKPNHKPVPKSNGTMRGFVGFAQDIEKQPLRWKNLGVNGEWSLAKAAGGVVVETEIFTNSSRGAEPRALLNQPYEVDVMVYPRHTNIAEITPGSEAEVAEDAEYDFSTFNGLSPDGGQPAPRDLYIDSYDYQNHLDFDISDNTTTINGDNQGGHQELISSELALKETQESERKALDIVNTASQAGSVLPYLQ